MPVHLTIANTNRCNLRCPMCIRQALPDGDGLRGEMDRDLFLRLAEETFPYLKRLALSVSGEPFLSSWLPDLLATVERFAVKLEVTSNGTLLADHAILERVVRNLASLTVSIDAATPATYEAIRVGAKFAAVVANLARLQRMRQRLPPAERPALGLACVLMRSNIEELPALVQLASELGLDYVGTAHLQPHRAEMAGESLAPVRELALRWAAEARTVAKRCGIAFQLPNDLCVAATTDHACPPAPAAATRKCHLPWERAWIEFDGTVAACCSPAVNRPILGNLRTNSFREIWSGLAYQRLREGIARGTPPPVCRDCDIALPQAILPSA